MQRPNNTDQTIEISVIEHNIHEMRWHHAGTTAVDIWFAYNEKLYQTVSIDETILFLHVTHIAKFPPIAYLSRKARVLQNKYPVQPHTRTAVLFESVFFGGFINTLSRLLNRHGQDITRFFRDNEREEAIAWLIEE